MSSHFWSKRFLPAAAIAAAALINPAAVFADDVKPAPAPTAPSAVPAPPPPPPAAPPAKPDFVTANSKDGFSINSGDGNFQLKIRGYLQADGRIFVEDPPNGDGTEFTCASTGE